VSIGLDYPDKLLTRVVEVKLNLVGRRTYRLIASELKLLNEVLVWVLGHTTALISVKEDVVNVERSSYERLVVSDGYLGTSGVVAIKRINSPEALINRTKVDVNLNLVVLKSNQRKSKTRVASVPELQRNV